MDLTAWRDFYLATATVSGALLGLVFVGMSLYQAIAADKNQPPLAPHSAWQHFFLGRTSGVDAVVLGTQTYIDYVYVLFISLLLLVPTSGNVHTVLVAGISLLGVLDSAFALFVGIRHRPHRGELAWRYLLPGAAFIGLAVSIGLTAADVSLGPYGLAAGVLLLLAAGTRNSWDIVLRVR